MCIRHSKELRQMLRERRGYRCEQAYGSEVRTPSAVAKHEIEILHNPHDSGWCEGLQIPHRECTPATIYKKLRAMDDTHEVLWLGLHKWVKDRYCEPDENPESYHIPKEVVVLQDLDRWGALLMRKGSWQMRED